MDAESVLRFVPLAADLLLDFSGAGAQHGFLDRGIAAGIGCAAVCATVEGLKYFVDEQRPDGSDFKSFPSGHSAIAFLGADLVRQEYGWGYGAAAYALATGVGAMRLCHERHWWWDVLAGAGIGIAGAQLGSALAPGCRRVLDKVFGTAPAVSLSPSYDPSSGALCGTLAIVF